VPRGRRTAGNRSRRHPTAWPSNLPGACGTEHFGELADPCGRDSQAVCLFPSKGGMRPPWVRPDRGKPVRLELGAMLLNPACDRSVTGRRGRRCIRAAGRCARSAWRTPRSGVPATPDGDTVVPLTLAQIRMLGQYGVSRGLLVDEVGIRGVDHRLLGDGAVKVGVAFAV